MAARGRSRTALGRAALWLAGLAAVFLALAVLWRLWWGDDAGQATPVEGAAAQAAASLGLPSVASAEGSITRRLRAERPHTRPLSGPARIRLQDVSWQEPGRDFLRARSMAGVLDMGALHRGNIALSQVRLQAPAVVLERRVREAEWNYERVLARFLNGEDAGAKGNGEPERGPLVVFDDVIVEDGRAEVRSPGERLVFRDVDAALSRILLSDPEGTPPDVEVVRFTAAAERPRHEPVRVSGRAARLRFPDGEIAFEARALAVDGSTLSDARGVWRPDLPGLGLELRVRARHLELADLADLAPGLPPAGTAAFVLELAPAPGGRSAIRLEQLDLSADDSRIRGALSLRLGARRPVELVSADLRLEPLDLALLERLSGDTLPYAGELRGRVHGPAAALEFDVVAALAPPAGAPFTSRLTGTAAFAAGALALRGLEAELEDVPLLALRPFAPGLPLRGTISGRITLRGPPGRALTLDVRLDVAGGTANVAGSLDVSGDVVAYDLRGNLQDVRLPALVEPEVPPVQLDARFTLAGSGTDPASASARLDLAGQFQGWRAGPEDSVRVRAQLRGGTLELDTAKLRLATLTADAGGRWRFLAPASGGITYAVAFESLEPFGSYLPALPGARAAGAEPARPAGPAYAGVRPHVHAGGALRTTGAVEGTLAALTLTGEATGNELRYGEWAASTLESKYALGFGRPVPRVNVELAARGIEAPQGGAYQAASGRFVLDDPGFQLEARADRAGGGAVEVAADGRIEPDERVLVLRRFNLDLASERWGLVTPAEIRWGRGQPLLVRNFLLRQVGGDGRLAVNGTLLPRGGAQLQVRAAALPIGDLLASAGQRPVVRGRLWLDADLAGARAAPELRGEFHLEQGALSDVAISRLTGNLRYEAGRLELEATATTDTAGTLHASAELPFTLAFEPNFTARLRDEGAVRALVDADRVPLGVLERLVPHVDRATGTLTARFTVAGSVGNPVLSGDLVVQNGAVTVPALNQRYQEIQAHLVLENRRAVVRDLRARSDGWIEATGAVVFEDLTRPTADLTLRFEGFRPIGVEDVEDAGLWGRLQVTGRLREPVVAGELYINDGNLPVSALGAGGDAGEEFADFGQPAPVVGQELTAAPPVPWIESVILDALVLEAGDNLWFTTREARVQLAGELTLHKTGPDLRVFGTLEGERGTFTLRAGPIIRRFDIRRAQVRFFGTPEPNPALDITAARVVVDPTGRQMEIQIRVTGTLQSPQVALSTAEGMQIPESELVSFLLFGQPSFAFREGELPGEALLEESLFGGLAVELEEALLGPLGLDIFQIRPSAATLPGFAAPTLVLGREVADDVFLTVESGLGVLFGPSEAVTDTWAVSLEWRIDPEWMLRFGIEPVNRGRLFRGITAALAVSRPGEQFTVNLRRRWTY